MKGITVPSQFIATVAGGSSLCQRKHGVFWWERLFGEPAAACIVL
jgi:hypothetical protein